MTVRGIAVPWPVQTHLMIYSMGYHLHHRGMPSGDDIRGRVCCGIGMGCSRAVGNQWPPPRGPVSVQLLIGLNQMDPGEG